MVGTTVVAEPLAGFRELRAGRRPGAYSELAFELAPEGAEQVWGLEVPWSARYRLGWILEDAIDRMAEQEELAFGAEGCAELACAELDSGSQLVAVILRKGEQRAFAIWRRERVEDGWSWTADVLVVPAELAQALCTRMLVALRRLEPLRPPSLPRRPLLAPRATYARLLGPGRPVGILRQLAWARYHLCSFEAAFVLFLYSNELKTLISFPFPVDETVAFAALAIGIGSVIVAREGIHARGLPVVIAATLFILWAVTSALWSPSSQLASKSAAYLLTFTMLSVVAGALIIAKDRERLVRFVVLVLIIAMIMALYGLYIYVVHGDFRRWAGWHGWEGRAYLAFGHTVANGAGIAFVIALFARVGSPRQLLASAAFCACLGFLLVGGGRGPLLGAVLAAVVGLATRPPEFVQARLAVPVPTLAAVTFLAMAAATVAHLLLSGNATTTLARFAHLTGDVAIVPARQALMPDRTDFYTAAIALWQAAPFLGHGLSSFSYLFTSGIEDEDIHPHNIFLQMLSELGLVGLVLFAFFFWAGFRHASLRRLRRDPLMVLVVLFLVTSSMSALFGRDIVGVRKFFFAISLLALRPPSIVIPDSHLNPRKDKPNQWIAQSPSESATQAASAAALVANAPPRTR